MLSTAVVTDVVDVLRDLVRDARGRDRTRPGSVPASVVDLLSALTPSTAADGEGLRTTQIAEAAGVGVPTVSRQVAAAEALGLLERSADPLDGRAARLRPTPAGRELVAEHRAARAEELRALLHDWAPEDADLLLALLRRLRAATAARAPELSAAG